MKERRFRSDFEDKSFPGRVLEQEEVPSTPSPAPCTAALTKPQYIWMLLQFHMLEIKEKLCKLFFFSFFFSCCYFLPVASLLHHNSST